VYLIPQILNVNSVGNSDDIETVQDLADVSGSYGSDYEDDCILGCCAMWSGRSLPTFQRCLLPPSSSDRRRNIPEDSLFIQELVKNPLQHFMFGLCSRLKNFL
jgi:hypothetical protein